MKAKEIIEKLQFLIEETKNEDIEVAIYINFSTEEYIRKAEDIVTLESRHEIRFLECSGEIIDINI